MTDVEIVHIFRQMAAAGVKVAGPLLAVMLVVGTVISIVQTITQVQEQAIVYVVKFAAVGIMLVVMGPWMLAVLTSFVREMYALIPELD